MHWTTPPAACTRYTIPECTLGYGRDRDAEGRVTLVTSLSPSGSTGDIASVQVRSRVGTLPGRHAPPGVESCWCTMNASTGSAVDASAVRPVGEWVYSLGAGRIESIEVVGLVLHEASGHHPGTSSTCAITRVGTQVTRSQQVHDSRSHRLHSTWLGLMQIHASWYCQVCGSRYRYLGSRWYTLHESLAPTLAMYTMCIH